MEQKQFNIVFRGTKYPCFYITELEDAVRFVNMLMEVDEAMGIDFETAALPQYEHVDGAALSPHLSTFRLMQISTPRNVVVFDMRHIYESVIPDDEPSDERLTLYNEFRCGVIKMFDTKMFIAHNAMFELMFMLKFGATTPNVACTMIMAKLIVQAGRAVDTSYSLENLCKGFLKTTISKNEQVSAWGAPELTFEQVHYAAIDAVATMDLAKLLKKGITNYNMRNYYGLVHATMPVIARMQLHGSLFDMSNHRELVVEWREELYDIGQTVKEMTGLDEITGPKMAAWFDEHVSDSDKRVWPRSDKTKRLKVDADTLSLYKNIEVVAPFERFQQLSTLLSRYGDNLQEYINPATRRIHSNFVLIGARTGRMSSNRPNEQNAPKDKAFRRKYVAPKGHMLCRADYSQIEMRVMAELSGDPVMRDAFITGKDLHDVTGAGIMGISLEEYKALPDYSLKRRFAKGLNFLLVYGGGAETYAKRCRIDAGVEKSMDEAYDEIQKWKELYSVTAAWQQEQARRAEKSLLVVTPYGKVRRLDKDAYYGASMNTPVQGGAAECMMLALCNVDGRYRSNGMRSVLIKCVHDELLAESPLDEVEDSCTHIVEGMTEAFLQMFPNGITNGLVAATYGRTWQEAIDKE